MDLFQKVKQFVKTKFKVWFEFCVCCFGELSMTGCQLENVKQFICCQASDSKNVCCAILNSVDAANGTEQAWWNPTENIFCHSNKSVVLANCCVGKHVKHNTHVLLCTSEQKSIRKAIDWLGWAVSNKNGTRYIPVGQYFRRRKGFLWWKVWNTNERRVSSGVNTAVGLKEEIYPRCQPQC